MRQFLHFNPFSFRIFSWFLHPEPKKEVEKSLSVGSFVPKRKFSFILMSLLNHQHERKTKLFKFIGKKHRRKELRRRLKTRTPSVGGDLHGGPYLRPPRTPKSFLLCLLNQKWIEKEGEGNVINKIPLIFQHVK